YRAEPCASGLRGLPSVPVPKLASAPAIPFGSGGGRNNQGQIPPLIRAMRTAVQWRARSPLASLSVSLICFSTPLLRFPIRDAAERIAFGTPGLGVYL